jgi:hypothetical protein
LAVESSQLTALSWTFPAERLTLEVVLEEEKGLESPLHDLRKQQGEHWLRPNALECHLEHFEQSL